MSIKQTLAILCIGFGAIGPLNAQLIYTYPSAIPIVDESITHWFQTNTYSYSGTLNSHYSSTNDSWDMSMGQLMSTDTIGVIYYDPSNTSLATTFPTADLAVLITFPGNIGGEGPLYDLSDDSLTQVGYAYITASDTGWTTYGPDPLIRMLFPFAVGDTLLDHGTVAGFPATSQFIGQDQGVLITPFESYPVASLIYSVESGDLRFFEPNNCLLNIATVGFGGGSFNMTYYTPIEVQTGVRNFSNDELLHIFPNPSSGELNIRCMNGFLPARLHLNDALGRNIWEGTLNQVAQEWYFKVPPGVYSLMAISARGTILQRRLVFE